MRALDALAPAQARVSGTEIEVSPKHGLALSLALLFATWAESQGSITMNPARAVASPPCFDWHSAS